MNMRHDLQYYYNYIIWQGTLLAKNKEQCTTQQILTTTTTTTTTSKSMENSYLNLTVRILQQNDSCYTDKQCDKCILFFGGPTCSEYLSSCKISNFGGVMVLAVELFNKIKKKKKKNLKKHVALYLPHVMSKYIKFV